VNVADATDRLIHVLLREILGGKTPPDLSGRILARAYGHGRRRVLALAAAAAVVLATVGAMSWHALGDRYAEPTVSGDYEIEGDRPFARGCVVLTGSGAAAVARKGHYRVELDRNSAVGIEGGEHAEQVFLRQGGVTCQVDRSAGHFAVRTEVGTASVTGTRFAVRIVRKEGGNMRMFAKVLVGTVLLSGSWGQIELAAGEEATVPGPKAEALGRIEAGKPRTVPRSGEAWRTRGRVVGRLRNAPACEIDLLDANGKIVKSARVPKGGKAYELEWLAAGLYALRIAANGYQTLTVEKLEVRSRNDLFVDIEFTPAGTPAPSPGKIEAGNPTYKPRPGEAWRNRGRIVGHLRSAPACEIDVLDADGQVVKSTRVPKGAKAYELQWLEAGSYALRVTASGFQTLTIEKLQVKTRNDLFVDIEFTPSTGPAKIEAGRPTYKPRTGDAWRTRGRVVGRLRNAPACEIDLLDANGQVVKSARVPKGGKAYELEWLEGGLYALRIAADGYPTLTIEKLEVRPRHDLFVNIEFTPNASRD